MTTSLSPTCSWAPTQRWNRSHCPLYWAAVPWPARLIVPCAPPVSPFSFVATQRTISLNAMVTIAK